MDANKRQRYEDQGYLILRGLLSSGELDALRQVTDSAMAERAQPIVFDSESREACAAVPPLYKDADGRVFRRLNRMIDRGGAFERVVFGPLAHAVTEILPPPV